MRRRCPRLRTLVSLIGMGAVLILFFFINTPDLAFNHAPPQQQDTARHLESYQDKPPSPPPPHSTSSENNARHSPSSQDSVRDVGSPENDLRHFEKSQENTRHSTSVQDSAHHSVVKNTVRHGGWIGNKVTPQTLPQTYGRRVQSSSDDLLGPAYRDDLLGQRPEEVNVSDYLKCVDPEGIGGVQDLLCMKRPNFLSHFKNPCWVDWSRELQRLRCLPYFHLLGVDKSGTTDLHSRLAQHPHVLLNSGGLGKETYYWCWTRYGQWMRTTTKPRPFGKYLTLFDNALVTMVDNTDARGYHPLVTGDGTPMDFWDFRAWPLIPQNRGLQEPAVLTPHLMRHVYQDPKFLLIFRNPVDRLYSDYIFLGYGRTPEEFREDVPEAVAMMEKCMMVNTTRQCVFSNNTYVNLPMRIHIGMYSVFLKEWLSVFPRSSFYILRTEDYHANMTFHLTNIFRFLDVAALPESAMADIVAAERKHETKAKKRVADMYPETRALLTGFYERFNQQLAELLDDARFLWLDTV